MKHVSITYTPRANVKFTERELEIMLTASERHYDAVCREASSDCVQGDRCRPGFLRGAYNYRKNTKGEGESTMDFRQLDTLAKILEMAHMSFHDQKDIHIIGALRGAISTTLRALNDAVLQDVPTTNRSMSELCDELKPSALVKMKWLAGMGHDVLLLTEEEIEQTIRTYDAGANDFMKLKVLIKQYPDETP